MRPTGQLGEDVRSARAAQSFVRLHAEGLGIDLHVLRHNAVHVPWFPAGATPEDGPSAGVAMVAALTSLYTGTSLRSDTAMTGEVTLTGLVLPVGGVKEKVLAARRAGMRQVVLPKDNEQDLHDLPDSVCEEMKFVFAERVEDVLSVVLPAVGRRLEVGDGRVTAGERPASAGWYSIGIPAG